MAGLNGPSFSLDFDRKVSSFWKSNTKANRGLALVLDDCQLMITWHLLSIWTLHHHAGDLLCIYSRWQVGFRSGCRTLTTQQALPRSAILMQILSAFSGSRGFTRKSAALKANHTQQTCTSHYSACSIQLLSEFASATELLKNVTQWQELPQDNNVINNIRKTVFLQAQGLHASPTPTTLQLNMHFLFDHNH